MKNKKLIRDLIEKLEDYNSRDLFEYHVDDIRNLVYDYMSKIKDYSLEDIPDEFDSYETVEDRAKDELENSWLERLYYFLWCWDVRLDRDRFIINNYWNLQNIDCSDMEIWVNELIDKLREDL